MEPEAFAIFMVIGLVAGMAGGLLGIGGSAIFIPAASLVIGADQQIYQAAAMILNVFVAASATIKHWRSRGIDFTVVRLMTPFAVGAVLIGVYTSNHLNGPTLARVFGIMLIGLACFEIAAMSIRRAQGHRKNGAGSTEIGGEGTAPRTGRLPYRCIGATMGGLGGLLGIGGGVIGVPLLRLAARQPLRGSIAAAAAVTLPLALIGAIYKNASLPFLEGEDASSSIEALLIAAAIVPTAVVGSWFGASMVHRLPIDVIRIAFIGLLLFAGYRMTTKSFAAVAEPAAIEAAIESSSQGAAVGPTAPQLRSASPTIPKIGNSAS